MPAGARRLTRRSSPQARERNSAHPSARQLQALVRRHPRCCTNLSYGPTKEKRSYVSRLGTSTASPGNPRLAAYVGKELCNSLRSAKDMHSGTRGISGNRIRETGHAFATIEENPAPEVGAFGGSAEGV